MTTPQAAPATPATPTTPTNPASGRVNQKRRTHAAIVTAAADLMLTGEEVTMPEVAKTALVSEATAYRYFPDLASLLSEAMADTLPHPDQAFATVAGSTDPVERVAAAAEHLARHVLARQGAVRAMIAATIVRPNAAPPRPGLRFGLIDEALRPLAEAANTDQEMLTHLKRDLSIVMGAEALFSLMDLNGLPPEDAVASIVRTATTLTRAAVSAP
ncbi:transcriptional regulator, TetR family [Catenulispora acidiphila DSM 44928]|uniref:Transcriptional regulator, TetR family n=1 Tax=Catenulispora acidiphila (strain DSM 44928 / JCM 14897 / NBRC 102108 / NRRL B-24433 / ID139908) TaxID=479433 RepID=C7QIL1_CATAD|nr:TetR/AcrR family transcriptional regulator [Catenulispora acidiphila]ACU75088.1 transcriptional regulator, TetR family [Catenulispora acidiphila DSM 44928]